MIDVLKSAKIIDDFMPAQFLLFNDVRKRWMYLLFTTRIYFVSTDCQPNRKGQGLQALKEDMLQFCAIQSLSHDIGSSLLYLWIGHEFNNTS